MNGIVLISGNGSNLQSIIDHSAAIDLDIKAVISNHSSAYGLKRAEYANILTHTLNHKQFSSVEEFDQELSNIINQYNPEIIILAGFMRILSAKFTNQYSDKMLNIHPSLLPKFQGLNTHKRVLEAKESQHGVSIHFVTEQLDGGPIIAQVSVDVFDTDTTESLAKRVLLEEHKLFHKVIHWFTQGRLKLEKNHATLDGKVL
ncbi:phosphoribosylglycinamide formyltransferase [Candidatus Ruthia magnifica str. Cm (Calyptogena magnifica)]|uniref:Phosphoribosylglycinamide formyltransferase n=1 Tax=Ruthia magnifica subsp. Calyptogena magnifica TaxID=413404 RepID=A1AVU0_RUTMC|nr:phosphoribosylglycinamide formyltransferase [Candidatus Ruthturnera calyptogenae]ABL02047.1 phosphoribosylglycinamide formyltransferase [Candidatus Ruthia magnifica str. Cm (Calyptogena magnifica)]